MSTWTKDKPTPGKWRLSFAPEKRGTPIHEGIFNYGTRSATVRCSVVKMSHKGEQRLCVDHLPGGALLDLSDDIFDGALWMPDPDPADPFAETQPRYSQDDDLP